MDRMNTLLGDSEATAQISESYLQSQLFNLLLMSSWVNPLLALSFRFLICGRVRTSHLFYVIHIVPCGSVGRIHCPRSEAFNKAHKLLLLLLIIVAGFS